MLAAITLRLYATQLGGRWALKLQEVDNDEVDFTELS